MDKIFIDIYVGGKFYCQIPYIDKDSYENREIEDYIVSKRPSLKSTTYHIEFSDIEIKDKNRMHNLNHE